jgi:hypothetical protein
MPHVIDDPDLLEHSAPTSDCEDSHALPHLLPGARRGRSTLFTSLRSILTSLRSVGTHQKQPHGPRVQPFELPMDILARKHPDLYLRSMTGVG